MLIRPSPGWSFRKSVFASLSDCSFQRKKAVKIKQRHIVPRRLRRAKRSGAFLVLTKESKAFGPAVPWEEPCFCLSARLRQYVIGAACCADTSRWKVTFVPLEN